MWCMGPEIWSATDNFLLFWTVFCIFTPLWTQKIKIKKKKKEKNTWRYHFTNVYHKWQSYDIWFLKYKVRQREIFNILGHFLPFQPLTTSKIKILTLKKTPGDIIFHICAINDNCMMYGSWDMEGDRHNFLSFWTVFYPFTLPWTQKIKIFKKMGKTPENIIIYKHK